MTGETEVQRLPEISAKRLYEGKFRDRMPNCVAAGKLTASGDTAEFCMRPENYAKRPESPEIVRKFRASNCPDAGKSKIFYGKALDPHLKWAKGMTHGVNTHPSLTTGTLINPNPMSRFKLGLLNKKESLYASHQRAPLGKSHDQTIGFPPGFRPENMIFGVQTMKDGSSGELVNPDKSVPQVDDDYNLGRHLYKKTHFGFDVGEQKHRDYLFSSFNPDNRYGIPTPHDNSGKHVKKTMHWIHEDVMEKGTPIVSKRLDDFRERTQPQLGKVHDPIKDTLNVPANHTFGILLKPDQYGAGDLLHNRGKASELRGQDRLRGVIAAMRQNLKKSNYHNFDDLQRAFNFYDKDKNGKIDIAELKEACHQFCLPVDDVVLKQVMDACDMEGNGMISYNDFVNYLNWKDKMKGDLLVSKSAPPEKSREAKKQPEVTYRTSSSMINASYGRLNMDNCRTYGTPTIRTDLPAPRIRRIGDRKNYGDESDASGLLNPNVYSSFGVYEKDFMLPRDKLEIRQIFVNIGVQLTDEMFDNLWAAAASQHPRGDVSVESFRLVLDRAQATSLLTRSKTIL